MPDVVEQLRSYGEAVESAVPVAEVPSPRNRRPFLLAAAALVLVACTAAGVWALRADDGGGEDAPVVDTTEVPPVESGWQTLDPGPLEPREGAATVWTGEELVVWGGASEETGDGFADGAAYDPDTAAWRTMNPSPTDGGRAVGVWTGEEVLLWPTVIPDAGSGPQFGRPGAAWNPSTDEWRALTAREGVAADGILDPVWTGTEMVDGATNSAYDPRTDRWRTLPPRPVDGEIRASVWTGDELLVLVANRSDSSYPAGEAVALAYAPSEDAWTALPPTGVGETGVALAWDGDQAVALDYEMQAAAHRPEDGTWRQLGSLPLRFYECGPRLSRIGETVLADHCSGYAVLTADDQWAIAAPAVHPIGELLPVDDTLMSWWSSDYGEPPGTSFQSYRPPAQEDRDLALTRTVPVGPTLLDLPDLARLTDTEVEEEAGGLVTGLTFELALGAEGRCTLRSVYAGPAAVRIRNDVSTVDADVGRFPLEQVDVDRDDALVARVAAGELDARAHVLLEQTTSDVLDIACDDLATAEDLLERIHR